MSVRDLWCCAVGHLLLLIACLLTKCAPVLASVSFLLLSGIREAEAGTVETAVAEEEAEATTRAVTAAHR